jgi:hypothetical protein
MLRNTSEERNARRNVYVIGVDGTSDDLDAPIMAVFGDAPFKHEHAISSVVCYVGLGWSSILGNLNAPLLLTAAPAELARKRAKLLPSFYFTSRTCVSS